MSHEFLRPGYNVQVQEPDVAGQGKYRKVVKSEMARYSYRWNDAAGADEPISPGTESAEKIIVDLKPLSTEEIYECIFGIRGPAYIYMNLPLQTRVGGLGAKPIATTANRSIGAITQEDSPWDDPGEMTLFYLMKGGSFETPALTAWNPSAKSICPEVRFQIGKHLLADVTEPAVIDKLQRGLAPSRMIDWGGLPPVRSGPG